MLGVLALLKNHKNLKTIKISVILYHNSLRDEL